MKLELVDDWRDWYKWWSVWLAAIAAGCSGAGVAYLALPPAWQDVLPEYFGQACAVGAVISAFLVPFAAVIKQNIGSCKDDSTSVHSPTVADEDS